MRYWPLTAIMESPMLHHTQTWELMCAYHTPCLSEGTMWACNQVAGRTPCYATPLVIVHTVDAPMRRVYLERPAPEDFALLERGGFIATEDAFGFVVDALH